MAATLKPAKKGLSGIIASLHNGNQSNGEEGGSISELFNSNMDSVGKHEKPEPMDTEDTNGNNNSNGRMDTPEDCELTSQANNTAVASNADALCNEAAEFALASALSTAHMITNATRDQGDDVSGTVCSECSSVIRNPANVVVHMRRHLNYRPYSCSRCAYSGYDEDDVQRHAARSHASGPTAFVRFNAHRDSEKTIEEMINKSRRVESANNTPVKTDKAAVKTEAPTPKKQPEQQTPQKSSIDVPTANASASRYLTSTPQSKPQTAAAGNSANELSQLLASAGGLFNPALLLNQTAAGGSQQQQLFQALIAGLATANGGAGGLTNGAAAAPAKPVVPKVHCQLCNNDVCGDTAAVIRHIKCHLQVPGYSCPFCQGRSTSLGSWSELAAHLSVVHQNFPQKTAEVSRAARQSYSRAVLSTAELAFGTQARISCGVCADSVPLTLTTIEQHMAEHKGNRPYKCGACQEAFFNQRLLRAHFTQQHPGAYFVFNFAPQLNAADEAASLERAFPSLAVEALESVLSDGSTSNGPMTMRTPNGASITLGEGGREANLFTDDQGRATITCQVCNASISRNMSCLIAHAKVHLAYKPLKCEYCNFRHFAMSKIRRHNARVHPGKSVKVSYHPITDINTQVKEMKKKCFGAFASSTVWERFESEMSLDSPGELGGGVLSPLPVGDDSPIPSPMTDTKPSDNESGGVGKRRCALCAADIANTHVAFDNHASQHLDYKPYHCTSCPYQSFVRAKVARHISQVHDGQSLSIDYRPVDGMQEKMTQMKMQCFPAQPPCTSRSPDNANDSDGQSQSVEEIKCQLCDATCLALEASMDEHLHTHIVEKYYHCPVCTYQTTFLIRAKQHVHSAHPHSQESRILCCPADGLGGLQTLRAECFGADVWERFRPLNINDMQALMDQNDSSDDERLSCGVCNALVQQNQPSLNAHARTHMQDYKPYQCTVCPFAATTEQDTKQHMINNHKSAPLKVTYNAESKQLSVMYDKCFPSARPYNGGSSRQGGAENSLFSSNTMLKKLTCQVCKHTIADNPKSIGIHVKNHLNYKPYRCPHCKYMSCEQSKARRHVEHVHNVSGLSVQTQVEDNIKERIIEMKARCFPTLVGDFDTAEDSQSGMPFNCDTPEPDLEPLKVESECHGCELCGEVLGASELLEHVGTHFGKPYKCDYCTSRFWTEQKIREHMNGAHPGFSHMFTCGNDDPQMQLLRAQCFPNVDFAQLECNNNNSNNNNNSEQPSSSAGTAAMPQLISSPEKSVLNTMDSFLGLAQQLAGFNEMREGACSVTSSDGGDQQLKPLTESSSSSPGKSGVKRGPAPPTGRTYNKPGAKDLPLRAIPIRNNQHTINKDSSQLADGRMMCRVCDQPVSVNPNSLDVHAKTHLNFKQHQCGYCSYRSCMSAKVKRHLENVHRGLEGKQTSLSSLPPNVRAIVNEMRVLCFPQLDNDKEANDSSEQLSTSELETAIGDVRVRLIDALHVAGNDNCLDPDQRRAALNAAQGINSAPTDTVIRPTNYDRSTSTPQLEGALPTQVPSSFVSSGNASPAVTLNTSNCGLNDDDMDDEEMPPMKMSSFADNSSMMNADDSNSVPNGPTDVSPSGLLKLLSAKLTAGMLNGSAHTSSSSPAATVMPPPPASSTVVCAECGNSVSADSQAKHSHALTHAHVWNCSDCGYAGLSEQDISVHADSEHGGAGQPIRLEDACGQELLTDAQKQQLVEQCFAQPLPKMQQQMSNDLSCSLEEDEDDEETMLLDSLEQSGSGGQGKQDAPRYQCQLCDQAVSMYASSLYVHVKNHLNYKPYQCPHCGYKSPVKSKVRRHLANAHKGQSQTVGYFPKVGIEESIQKMKKQCFPEVTAYTANTNAKVRCTVCKTEISDTPLSIQVHVKNHMDVKPFHCSLCAYRSCLRGETRRHITRQHPDDTTVQVQYRQDQDVDRNRLDQMIAQCFPDKPSKANGNSSSSNNNNTISSFATINNNNNNGNTIAAMAATPPNNNNNSGVKLGQAFREWYCVYCDFSATSKYHVKEHCITAHPGQSVRVSGHRIVD